MVSAHWENAPVTLSATRTVPLVYDFWGFPARYYETRYPAPGAPDLAAKVGKLVRTPVQADEDRGLDHGAYVPLTVMYPDADIPVLQMSMPTLDPAGLMDLGRQLAPLRDEGVLIVGSGFLTHNLSCVHFDQGPDYAPPAWSREFDAWADERLAGGDIDNLLDFAHKAPAPTLAHPRTEHLAPLFVALGAAGGGTPAVTIDGFWYGLSKRSVQFG